MVFFVAARHLVGLQSHLKSGWCSMLQPPSHDRRGPFFKKKKTVNVKCASCCIVNSIVHGTRGAL